MLPREARDLFQEIDANLARVKKNLDAILGRVRKGLGRLDMILIGVLVWTCWRRRRSPRRWGDRGALAG